MTTLLLSDLHLPASPSSLRESFRHFLAGPARQAQRVYILGDLFEVWIGDDVGLADYAPEAEALRALVRYGVPVLYQHGNRDFMVGRQFAKATGLQVLKDPLVADIEGSPTLLSHGDLFCTDDRSYQRYRRISRLKGLQWIARNLPLATRQRIAGSIRGRSSEMKQMKAEDILDVNSSAIVTAFRRHGVRRMIHGHTHRPAHHQVPVDGQCCERIVLADWTPQRMEYLRITASTVEHVAI